MSTVGIIAEFNPLHTGHKRLIDHARTLGDTVACVISGNFVQRGDVAIISKQQRAKFALLCGSDIIEQLKGKIKLSLNNSRKDLLQMDLLSLII